MAYWEIPRLWEGQTAVVMASGESLTKEDAEAVRHLPRIVTNGTFQMAPDANIVYASDALFWHNPEYRARGLMECPGFKVSCEAHGDLHPNTPDWVLVVRTSGKQGFDERQTHIRTGSNSGYASIHIAATAGAKRILLLGLDMTGGHWHGKHPHGLNNPRPEAFARWMKHFDSLALALQQRGVEVINCSPISRLRCFRKATLADCL